MKTEERSITHRASKTQNFYMLSMSYCVKFPPFLQIEDIQAKVRENSEKIKLNK